MKERRECREEIRIKNQVLGMGRPLVCVPIVGQSREDILAAAELIVEKGADMIEWRMDWWKENNWEQMEEILECLAGICKDVILLCTFRSRHQGGELEIAEEDYIRLLQRIARSGHADLLDVEVAELTDKEKVIQELHKESVYILASQHYFSHTPETGAMERELCHMKELGADVGKLAVMPRKNTDVLRLMEATMNVKEQYSFYPVVTMAMGEMGLLSRISGQMSGSCITFGTVGKSSAPGQIPLEDAVVILDKIAKNLE